MLIRIVEFNWKVRREGQTGMSAAEYVRKRRETLGASFAEPSRMEATVERHVPQRLPAPVFSMISVAELSPDAAASRMSFSVTAMQMQTYISRPYLVVRRQLLLRIAFKFDCVNQRRIREQFL